MPQSVEGRDVWDVVLRIGHQLRVADGRIIGFDFNAAFTVAAALGVCATALANWLPQIEAVAVREMNRIAREG